jgi:DNA polymerase I-like protein with 3'-5' exonuclease and polymerase domains
MRDAQKELLTGDATKIIQNMAFDVPHLHADGFPITGPYWDTMYAAQLIDPDSPGFSLEEMASFILELERWKHKGNPTSKPRLKIKQWKKPFACARYKERGVSIGGRRCKSKDKPVTSGSGVGKARICDRCTRDDFYHTLHEWEQTAIEYNRMDAGVLIPIQEWQRYRLNSTGMGGLFQQMMHTLETVLIPMQQRGIRVDKKVRAEWTKTFESKVTACKAEWCKVTENVNHRSPKQMRELVYEKWGLPKQYKWDRKTKSRKLALDNEAIENLLVDDTPASLLHAKDLKLLQEYKKAQKWLETYIKIGDRIYPRYGPAKKDDQKGKGGRYGGMAATGRIIAKGGDNLDGSKTPPIQQFPEEMKKLILPDREVFISWDYAQQELRICAYMSECAKLTAMIEEGADIHAYNAEKFKCDRTRAKNMFYRAIFGAKGRALVRELRAKGFALTVEEADDFILQVRREYPEIFKWHDKLLAMADRQHYVEDAFGGRRYFYTREKRVNEILNYPIQATGARLQWVQLPDIKRACERAGGFLSILQFDSVVADADRRVAPELITQVKDIMQRRFPRVHPDFYCPVDVKMGPSWGDMERV